MQYFKNSSCELSKPTSLIKQNVSYSKGNAFEQSTTLFESFDKTFKNIKFKDKMIQSSEKQINGNSCGKYRNESLKQKKSCAVNSHKNTQLNFHPKIHQLSYELYPQSFDIKMNISKEKQWENLIEDHRARDKVRKQQKNSQNQILFQKCTFTPLISKNDNQHTKRTNKSQVFIKLYGEAQTKSKKYIDEMKNKINQEDKQIQMNKKYLPSNLSKWKILNSEKHDTEPLYKRIEKVNQNKKKMKKKLQQKYQKQFTFQPTINKNSMKIANNNPFENFIERLVEEYKKKQNKIANLKQKYEKQQQSKLTFKPELNQNLNIVCKYQQILNKTVQKVEQLKLFVPKINSLSNLMVKDERNNENFEQKVDRMAYEPIISKQNNLHKIAEEMYEQCSFNPEINDLSKELHVYKNSVTEYEVHKHHCESPEELVFTHRPNINSRSKCMTDVKKCKSLDQIKHKYQELALSTKKQHQYQEIKECSFQPKVNHNLSQRKKHNKNQLLQEVAGIEKFIKTVQKANRKKKDINILQEKVFNLQKQYDQRMQRLKKSN